jgi:hypothetical protein
LKKKTMMNNLSKPIRRYYMMLILSLWSCFMHAQGNVGIGTLLPTAQLHIKSNSTVTTPQLLLEEDDNDFSRLTFTNNTTSKYWSTAAYPNSVDSLAWFSIYNSSTGNLLTLNGKGKLGIGTNPAYPLSFNNSLGDKVALWGGGGYGSHYGFGIQVSLLQIHTANANDDVAFGYGSSTAFTENVRITGDGKVGIGTNDPLFPLSFASSLGDKIALNGTNASSHYGFGVQNNLLQIHSSTNTTDIAFGYGGSTAFTESMRIKGNGRVGIGTNTPDSRLHVASGASGMDPNGFSVATIENSASAYMSILSATESGVLFGAGGNSSDGGIIYNNPTVPNGLCLRANNNISRLVISADGNVGIGNFLPAFPLSFTSTLGDKITLWGNNPASHFGFGIQPALLQIMTGESTSDIVFGYGGSTSFTEGVRITGDGKIGIGTPSPTAELEVDGFTKLGSSAPKIKMKKLTGTTSSSQGAGVNVPHGLDVSKILAVNVLVAYSGSNCVPPGYTFNAGVEYHFTVTDSYIQVFSVSGNSYSILSKPIKIMITYEE